MTTQKKLKHILFHMMNEVRAVQNSNMGQDSILSYKQPPARIRMCLTMARATCQKCSIVAEFPRKLFYCYFIEKERKS